jgi:hypothetical protein
VQNKRQAKRKQIAVSDADKKTTEETTGATGNTGQETGDYAVYKSRNY